MSMTETETPAETGTSADAADQPGEPTAPTEPAADPTAAAPQRSLGSVGPIFSVGGAVDRPAGDPAEDFHEASKITRITHPGWTDVRYAHQMAQEAQGVPDAGPGGATSAPRLLPALPLPRALPLRHELGTTLAARRSAEPRSLGRPVALAELATVLRLAYGPRGDGTPGRYVPSGGGLYPLDLHVVARSVTGLEPGIHQLDPLEETLVDVSGLERASRLARFRRAAPSLMAPIGAMSDGADPGERGGHDRHHGQLRALALQVRAAGLPAHAPGGRARGAERAPGRDRAGPAGAGVGRLRRPRARRGAGARRGHAVVPLRDLARRRGSGRPPVRRGGGVA
jgi:hypothetical protein